MQAVQHYTDTLERLLPDAGNSPQGHLIDGLPGTPIRVKKLTFTPHWHGLVLETDKLKHLVATFAQQTSASTRQEPLHLKDWFASQPGL